MTQLLTDTLCSFDIHQLVFLYCTKFSNYFLLGPILCQIPHNRPIPFLNGFQTLPYVILSSYSSYSLGQWDILHRHSDTWIISAKVCLCYYGVPLGSFFCLILALYWLLELAVLGVLCHSYATRNLKHLCLFQLMPHSLDSTE